MRANKICPYCHIEFEPTRTNQVYCTKKHGWDFRNENKENIWDNVIFKRIKSNEDLLKAVLENPNTKGTCSWSYLLDLGFTGQYRTHQKTVGYFMFDVMIKYGYYKDNNGQTTIKKIYE